MKLTKGEIKIAERCISKREKQLAQWPRKRWVLLTIYSVLMLIGYLIVNDGKRSIYDDRATEAQVSRALGEGPPPGLEHRWAVGTMMKISTILEARHQLVTLSLMEMAAGFMPFISGLAMVCIIILRWNTGERDALICKLLRAKLQELEPDAARNSRPSSQLQASPEVQSSDSLRTPSSGCR
ncbi:MAG TPA: hypothetical protein VN673_08810 [Clostridia bacterium]|nr:hypothetical protein [Clostridia bacterium]